MRLFLLPIYLRIMQERDIKVVTIALLEDQRRTCNDQILISNNTASAANIATTQPGFNSLTGYATDYKFRASHMANIVTIFVTICNNKNFGQKVKITIK